MVTPNALLPLRVLVVDDSVINRRSIAEIFANNPSIEVVGKAADGEEALRLVDALKPDAVTLDLEMPRMDGFTFLRILMTRRPTPVIVVSSYSQKENLFKALELGALDFVAKPDRYGDPELVAIREELVRKVLLVRSIRRLSVGHKPESLESGSTRPPDARSSSLTAPQKVIAIASSTGGPSALMEIFSRLPENYPHAVLMAQHMPDKFTRTFAERLDRRSRLGVSEAQDRDGLSAGSAFVCPGQKCMEVECRMGTALSLRVMSPSREDQYVPSADRLLTSAALLGRRAVGVILTGMGEDGVRGARAILESGGIVLAEAESTAIVYGMPGAAVRANVVTRSLPLGEMAEFLARL